MIKPELPDFLKLAQSAGLVPICREIIVDLDTPLTIFGKVACGREQAFLLESLQGGEKWGRYSFIGFDPLATFESNGTKIKVSQNGDARVFEGDPIEGLKSLIHSFSACNTDYLPRFFGGAVGYMGYDMVRFMEEIPQTTPSLDNFPDSSFMVPKIVLIYDNIKQTVSIVNCILTDDKSLLKEKYQAAVSEIDQLIKLLRAPLSDPAISENNGTKTHEFSANMSRASFEEMVKKAQEYILAGDIIQVVLSQRFHTETQMSPFNLYRALRHINPSPYLFYLQLGDVIQIGSSPEILVRLDDENIEVRPIAGTRKRGSSEEEDLALEKELLADPKEMAEHLMLVDLGRNDIGRVAQFGSVEMKDLLVIEKYSHVMHIVSGVHGKLADGKDQFDVLKACFPAGTVSGAPKIRAMEIIEELEPERRGPYAGAVGYFGFSGNMDICITIRTFVMQGQNLWIQAGAGIVADSDPNLEYEETLNKARGLRRAVELVEKGF